MMKEGEHTDEEDRRGVVALYIRLVFEGPERSTAWGKGGVYKGET